MARQPLEFTTLSKSNTSIHKCSVKHRKYFERSLWLQKMTFQTNFWFSLTKRQKKLSPELIIPLSLRNWHTKIYLFKFILISEAEKSVLKLVRIWVIILQYFLIWDKLLMKRALPSRQTYVAVPHPHPATRRVTQTSRVDASIGWRMVSPALNLLP